MAVLDRIGFRWTVGGAPPAKPGTKPAPRNRVGAQGVMPDPVAPPGVAGAAPVPLPPTAETMGPDDTWGFSPWWRALWILSTTLARTPCNVCKLEGPKEDPDATPIFDHPASALLSTRANDEETAQQVRQRLALWAAFFGRALAYIYRPADGRDYQLIPILPGDWFPMRVEGKKWYFVNPNGFGPDAKFDPAVIRKFRPEDMFYLHGMTSDGLVGLSVWRAAGGAIAEGLTGQRVRGTRATNAGKPALFLQTDEALPDGYAKKLQEDFIRIHIGFEASQIPAVLDRGLKATTLPYAADQAHEAALAALPLRDIANYTGVPVSFLADPNRSDNTQEIDDIQLNRYGLGWWFDRFADEGNSKLLREDEWTRRTHAVRFDMLRMEWLDARSRAELVRVVLAGNASGTVNEVRRKLGWARRPEPAADELQAPLNIGNAGGDRNTPADPSQPGPGRPPGKKPPAALPPARGSLGNGTTAEGLRGLAVHTAARGVRWVTSDARRQVGGAAEFCAFVDTIAERYGPRWAAEREVLSRLVPGGVPDVPAVLADLFGRVAESATVSTLAAAVDAEAGRIEREYPPAFGVACVPFPDSAEGQPCSTES